MDVYKLKGGYNVLAQEFGADQLAGCIGLPPRTVITFKDDGDDSPRFVATGGGLRSHTSWAPQDIARTWVNFVWGWFFSLIRILLKIFGYLKNICMWQKIFYPFVLIDVILK